MAELTEISIARMSRPVRPPTSGGAVGSRCSAERPWCVGGRWSVVVRESAGFIGKAWEALVRGGPLECRRQRVRVS